MTPERWQQVKSALAEALERPTPAERAAFLASTYAGDTSLRREVESLLDQPEDEFDTCADTAGFAHVEALHHQTESGRRIGAYQLVRELGRGGMGTVWLATRADEEFHKEVALKLLNRGTDTDDVLRRFRAEREILARLEHPNIARLLDGGTTNDGLPYFVMEYVVGARVPDYAFAAALTLQQRLELFRKICAAVQFAHQNLVVHRDLKPANILVTADGEPKLLDFGIAKLLGPTEGSWEMTMAGRERLTPGYASPEQVRGEPVTTVSDVYALGVLLYELVAERPAHRFCRTQPTTAEILRVVCEDEPLRPSVVAQDPARRRQLRGDLDTIILRAISKAPERRYRGAGQLADDVRRYLAGWPVRARKDTVAYRAGKFIKRNKIAASAALAIVLTLSGGIVATARQARIAQAERAKAERRFDELRRIANSFMFEVHNSIADLPGALAARQLVTHRALEYLDSLAQEAGDDLSLKSELAHAYDRIGRLTFDMQQAVASHQKAAALNESLVAAQPTDAVFRRQLADSYAELSDVMKIGGHSAAAIDFATKSLSIARALATESPSDATRMELVDCYLSLGVALIDAGDATGALAADRSALEIQQALVATNPHDEKAVTDLGNVYSALSDAHDYHGDYADALSFARNASDIAQQMFAREPGNARYQRYAWSSHFRIGRELLATGDLDGAEENYARAVSLMEKLSAADPDDRGHRRWLAVTYLHAGELLAARGRNDEALARYRQAQAMTEKLVADDSERVEARRDLVQIEEAIGQLLTSTGAAVQGLEHLSRANSLAESLVAADQENARVRSRLADVKEALAGCHRALAHMPGAADHATNEQAACGTLRDSAGEWQVVRQQGMLTPIDATKAEHVAEQLRACGGS